MGWNWWGRAIATAIQWMSTSGLMYFMLPTPNLSAVSTFGEDSAGEVYVGELNSGNIYRLEQVPPPGC